MPEAMIPVLGSAPEESSNRTFDEDFDVGWRSLHHFQDPPLVVLPDMRSVHFPSQPLERCEHGSCGATDQAPWSLCIHDARHKMLCSLFHHPPGKEGAVHRGDPPVDGINVGIISRVGILVFQFKRRGSHSGGSHVRSGCMVGLSNCGKLSV